MNTIKTVIIISKGDLLVDFLNMMILMTIYVKAGFLYKYPLNLLSTFNFIQTTINNQGICTTIQNSLRHFTSFLR